MALGWIVPNARMLLYLGCLRCTLATSVTHRWDQVEDTRAYLPSSHTCTDPNKQLFHDMVIKNIDTRVVKNTQGDIIFLYSFPNESTIVITSNAKTFNQIIDKLKRANLVK